MSIRKRGAGYQVSLYHNGNRLQRQADTLPDAEELQAAMLEELKAKPAAPLEKRGWTLQDAFLRTWERYWRDTKWAPKKMQLGKAVLRQFGKETPLDQITSDDVDAWAEALKASGASNGTINRRMSALSKILGVAVERGALASRPHIVREREPEGRIRWLSAQEEARVLALLRDWEKHDHADAVCLLVDTGMRTGELWTLRTQDITGRMVAVWETKADHPRSIPMTARVQAILERRSVGCKDRLFPYSNDWLGNQWERARHIMGLSTDSQFVPHALRHTCASRLTQAGFSIHKVQKWLGHKTIQTTLRYAHLAPEHLLSGADLLEGWGLAKPTPSDLVTVTGDSLQK